MVLVITLAVLMAFIALAGYYIGPGLGYYGAAGLCFVLLLGILYRVFAGGPKGSGLVIRPEVEGLPDDGTEPLEAATRRALKAKTKS